MIAPISPLWLRSADGTRLRAAHWPGPGPVILLLNGRTEFMEKHAEAVGRLTGRGYEVWSMDWRGQGRSDRLLADPVPNHVRSFADYLADLDALIAAARPGLRGRRLTALGISMGGHVALRHAAAYPGVIERLVLCAPMVDFPRPRWARGHAVQAIASLNCLVPGRAGRIGPGTRKLPDPARPFADNPLTSDPVRFAADLAWLREPGLAVGGATWGWLRAATQSIATLRRPGVADRITAPALALLAGQDRIVDNEAARRFFARLPGATLVEIPGARHELLREQDAVQDQVWAAFDRFMAPTTPQPAPAATAAA